MRSDPQFFVDDHLVDNRWGIEYLTETVLRVRLTDFERQPLLGFEDPGQPVCTDGVCQEVTWESGSIPAGQEFRLSSK